MLSIPCSFYSGCGFAKITHHVFIHDYVHAQFGTIECLKNNNHHNISSYFEIFENLWPNYEERTSSKKGTKEYNILPK